MILFKIVHCAQTIDAVAVCNATGADSINAAGTKREIVMPVQTGRMHDGINLNENRDMYLAV